MLLDESAEKVARKLGIVIDNEYIGKAGPRTEAHIPNDYGRIRRRCGHARGHRMNLTRQEVHMVLNHVESGRRRR